MIPPLPRKHRIETVEDYFASCGQVDRTACLHESQYAKDMRDVLRCDANERGKIKERVQEDQL